MVNQERSGLLKILATRATGGQTGFTLIEMIVVVGIIALLATVVVANVHRFAGSGERSAKDVELDNLQKAMELMMAQNQVFAINPHDSSSSSNANNDWTSFPSGGPEVKPLKGYLVNTSTVYYYCYDGNGIVTEQFETAAACTLP
jgi:prepilin-type N-terminal cleavage/methylation domain-containing protein